MDRQIHNLIQGSQEWHNFKSCHYGASEAAAMLGLSSDLTRNDLLLYKKTGKSKEYSNWVQKNIFDYGHDVESKARAILLEEGLDFFPVTFSLGKLNASCDGITIDHSLAFEHKQYNKTLFDFISENETIPDSHMPQCQQILMVTGADKLLFVCSDGTKDNWIEIEIHPNQEWFDRINAGWEQFEKDFEMYEHKEFADKIEAAPILQLPALSIQIKGEVTVSNLPQFKEAAETFIANINTNLTTDEDFVNAEATVKFCDDTEKKLEAAKAAAIGQTASIDELMRTIDFIKESIRSKRLTLEKLVKSQKESIKSKIIDDAYRLCAAHQSDISSEFKVINFAALANLSRQSFETVCKNKRTLASLHNAVDTEVAAIKIKLNDLARIIRKNMSHLPDDLSLFRDLQSIITKPEDDFKLLAIHRMEDYERKKNEAAKIASEAERQKLEDKAILESQLVAKKDQNEVEQSTINPKINKEVITTSTLVLSENVKQKLEQAIEAWADEILPGIPALLANAVYFEMLAELQKRTNEIIEKFPVEK